ncbi:MULTISPECIES: hypothetical protein [Frankia]|uniref:hypothetical protein n=2 Tax=Frankiaceae TaxID=74712 RepID=UPI0006EC167F|nr:MULTISPECIES: hypothetical protein [Frankia]
MSNSDAAPGDSTLQAWQREVQRREDALTTARDAYLFARLALVAHQIRTFPTTNGVDLTAAAQIDLEITYTEAGSPRAGLNLVMAADDTVLADWHPQEGAADLLPIEEAVADGLHACVANGLPSSAALSLPPADTLPPPVPEGLRIDPATPEGLAITSLWEELAEIEKRAGDWNGGDVVDVLGCWFASLGYSTNT